MSRKVETEFAFDIGDVVRLKAWDYTMGGWMSQYAPENPVCVYQITELVCQVCEGGLQRKYTARPVSGAGNCTREYFSFLESELELAEKLPPRPAKSSPGDAT